jgi:hypothetical protein
VPREARRARGRDRARGGRVRVKILVVDNYDSFTWNLVHLFEERGRTSTSSATTRSRSPRPRSFDPIAS